MFWGGGSGRATCAHLRKLISWVRSAMCHQLPGRTSGVAASGLEASIRLYRTFDTGLDRPPAIVASRG